jgi:hypothetical protein
MSSVLDPVPNERSIRIGADLFEGPNMIALEFLDLKGTVDEYGIEPFRKEPFEMLNQGHKSGIFPWPIGIIDGFAEIQDRLSPFEPRSQPSWKNRIQIEAVKNVGLGFP